MKEIKWTVKYTLNKTNRLLTAEGKLRNYARKFKMIDYEKLFISL